MYNVLITYNFVYTHVEIILLKSKLMCVLCCELKLPNL